MLGVSWPIYVAIDSPNIGFPYFNFLRGVPVRVWHFSFETFLFFMVSKIFGIKKVLDLVSTDLCIKKKSIGMFIER